MKLIKTNKRQYYLGFASKNIVFLLFDSNNKFSL